MKKTLLTSALLTALFSVSSFAALPPYVLYDGTAGSFLNGGDYKFDNAIYVDSLADGATDKFLYMAGSSTGYYIGGVGFQSFSSLGDQQSIAYTGLVSESSLHFSAFTKGTSMKVKIQLKGSDTWGYEFDLAAAAAEKTMFSVDFSEIKAIVDNNPTGAVITDDDLKTVTEVQFILVCTANEGVCDGVLELDDLVIKDGLVAGVQDNFLASNKEEVVSVFDIMGKLVATGKLKDLNLESGKLYVVKAGNTSRKIVMN